MMSLSPKIARFRRLFPWLLVAILLTTCLGLGFATQAAAGEGEPLWRERTASGSPALPRGFTPLPSLANLVKQLKPAVVNVYTTQVVKSPFHGRFPRFRDPFFEEFFGGHKGLKRFFGGPQGEIKRNSLGSGFIISPDGYVITNYHVVANASEIKVKLADERVFDAKVVGSDEKTDVVLLKVGSNDRLPVAYLGDSDKLQVGDWVVAIGNPFGLGHTVTAGIISGKEREIGQGPYDDFLQTDASINMGNSGGPLFDTSGNVVGINSAIISGGSGIGFAVPINLVKELLPQLRSEGKVTRGWLGVGIQNLSEELAEDFGVKRKGGVLVSQVFADSPAEKAGLKAGDIILSVNGRKVNEVRQLTRKIASLAPEHVVRVKALRDGKQRTMPVTLGEREKGESLAMGRRPSAPEEADLGLTLAPLTPDKARRLGVAGDLRGLVVLDVDRKSPAAGFVRSGDIVFEVNRIRVATVKEFLRAAARSKKRKKVLLRIQRETSQLYVVISR